MPCLFALIAVLSPRLALLLLWLFSPWVDKAFAGFFLPLLGLIFLPWTTLMYVLVDAPAGGIHVAGWILVGLGFVLDLKLVCPVAGVSFGGVRVIDAATLAIGLFAGGFWILAALSVILALAALLSVFRNEDFSDGSRWLWVAVILVFPLFGSLIYFGVRSDW